jgi:hypothetical protein
MNDEISTTTVTRKERKVEMPAPAAELEQAMKMMRENMAAQPGVNGELMAEIRDGFVVLSYELGRA